jgi:hypothetical protein
MLNSGNFSIIQIGLGPALTVLPENASRTIRSRDCRRCLQNLEGAPFGAQSRSRASARSQYLFEQTCSRRISCDSRRLDPPVAWRSRSSLKRFHRLIDGGQILAAQKSTRGSSIGRKSPLRGGTPVPLSYFAMRSRWRSRTTANPDCAYATVGLATTPGRKTDGAGEEAADTPAAHAIGFRPFGIVVEGATCRSNRSVQHCWQLGERCLRIRSQA